MKTDIQPIDTTYNGYRFRSRLEARWAMALDLMGATYEYEREGYNINGEWYLPDFWLPYEHGEPGWGEWLEIKPDLPLTDAQIHLFNGTAKLTGHRVLVACGSPWSHHIHTFQHYHLGKPKSVPLASDGFLAHNPHTQTIHLVSPSISRVQTFADAKVGTFIHAIASAKAARFDGEQPKVTFATLDETWKKRQGADILPGETETGYLERVLADKRRSMSPTAERT
jgi:hypothetical protein